MFQKITVSFLRLKAFIFYFPPPPAGFRQRRHIFLVNGKICQEQKSCFYVFCLPPPFCFLFYFHIPFLTVLCYVYLMAIIINVRNEVMPAGSVTEFLSPAVLLCFFQPAVFICNRRDAAFFIAEDIVPTAAATSGKEIFTRIKAVRTKTGGKLWEFLLKPFHQPVICLSFTVLFFRFFPIRIFNKFSSSFLRLL